MPDLEGAGEAAAGALVTGAVAISADAGAGAGAGTAAGANDGAVDPAGILPAVPPTEPAPASGGTVTTSG
jgi:hypothetical protein